MKNLPWILMGTILVVITCSVTGFLLNGIHHTSAAINPQADLVKGFPPIMPAFGDLKKEELEALVEFIKSVK